MGASANIWIKFELDTLFPYKLGDLFRTALQVQTVQRLLHSSDAETYRMKRHQRGLDMPPLCGGGGLFFCYCANGCRYPSCSMPNKEGIWQPLLAFF